MLPAVVRDVPLSSLCSDEKEMIGMEYIKEKILPLENSSAWSSETGKAKERVVESRDNSAFVLKVAS